MIGEIGFSSEELAVMHSAIELGCDPPREILEGFFHRLVWWVAEGKLRGYEFPSRELVQYLEASLGRSIEKLNVAKAWSMEKGADKLTFEIYLCDSERVIGTIVYAAL